MIEDHCLVGAEPRVHLDQLESVTGQFGLTPPLHFGPVNANVTIKGTGIRTRDRYARCKDDVRAALFDVRFNQWCEYSHHGQCAFAGVYQPALPTQKEFGNFVLLGNYVDLFNMLGLPETTNVHEMGDAALKVCGDTDVPFPAKDHHTLSQNELCFVAALSRASIASRVFSLFTASRYLAFSSRIHCSAAVTNELLLLPIVLLLLIGQANDKIKIQKKQTKKGKAVHVQWAPRHCFCP